MRCESPLVRGPRKGQPATGTWAGYLRHRKAGEQACDDCLAACVRNTIERRERNPDYDERQRERDRARKRERYATDPEYKAMMDKKSDRAKLARYRSDPEYREKQLERRRRSRQANPAREREIERARRNRELGARGSHTEVEWQAVLEQFGGRCAYCGSEGADTRDHLRPLSGGGTDDISNIVPACRSCNSSKGNRTLAEWWAMGGGPRGMGGVVLRQLSDSEWGLAWAR